MCYCANLDYREGYLVGQMACLVVLFSLYLYLSSWDIDKEIYLSEGRPRYFTDLHRRNNEWETAKFDPVASIVGANIAGRWHLLSVYSRNIDPKFSQADPLGLIKSKMHPRPPHSNS